MIVEYNLKWRKVTKIVAYIDLAGSIFQALTIIGFLILINKQKEGLEEMEVSEGKEGDDDAADIKVDKTLKKGNATQDNVKNDQTKTGGKSGANDKSSSGKGSESSANKSDAAKTTGKDKEGKPEAKSKGSDKGNPMSQGDDGENGGYDFKKMASQALEVSSLVIHFWTANKLIKSTNPELEPHKALKNAVIWRNIHYVFILGYGCGFAGILLELVPLKMYAAIFIGFLFHTTFIYIVMHYVAELRAVDDKPLIRLLEKAKRYALRMKENVRQRFAGPITELPDLVGDLEGVTADVLDVTTT